MQANYEFLTVDTVADYLAAYPALAARLDLDSIASTEEIGDGNLNLVFLIKDTAGRGLCVKQALPYVRMVGEGWPMTPERSRFEAQSLEFHSELDPDTVVELLHYDPERYILVMEDLSDHTVWRGDLIAGANAAGAAAQVGRYVARVMFGTSALGCDRTRLAQQESLSVNPELCVITEDLVFSEPCVDAGRNSVLPANEQDAAALAADADFVRAMGEAKWIFMTRREALIHGDLHTGSVMVKTAAGQATSVKAFDSEFAFYGPIAYDLGLLWANLLTAAARRVALGDTAGAEWAAAQVGENWDAFAGEMRKLWPQRLDPRVWDDAMLERLLEQWRCESWLFAAAEMSRRTVGVAKNADIETLEPELREGAARGLLELSRKICTVYTGARDFTELEGRTVEVMQQHSTAAR